MPKIYLTLIVLSISFQAISQCLITGADLSYVNTIVDEGGTYQDENGNTVEPFQYFADRGTQMVRLRLWHNPSLVPSSCGGPITACDLEDVLLAAKKATDAGMQVKLSLHFGDYFNDPGGQLRPQAWLGLDHEDLLLAVDQYVTDVLDAMLQQNTVPAIVAVGNETTWGFLDANPVPDGFSDHCRSAHLRRRY